MLSNAMFGMCKHRLNGAAAWKRERVINGWKWVFPPYHRYTECIHFNRKKIATMLLTLICMLRLIGVSVKQNLNENMLCSRIWGQFISGASFFLQRHTMYAILQIYCAQTTCSWHLTHYSTDRLFLHCKKIGSVHIW